MDLPPVCRTTRNRLGDHDEVVRRFHDSRSDIVDNWLSKSLEAIPLSLAYSIWVGIGAAGGVILGMLYLNESKNRWRIFFLLMIISSVIGLKVVS